MVNDAAKLALIGKAEISCVLEVDGKMLETKRRSRSSGNLEMSSHSQVDFKSSAVIQVNEDELPAAAESNNTASGESYRYQSRINRSQNSSEVSDADSGDRLTHE